MNSMLRQNNIRLQDLEGYLRGYDPGKPVPQDEWAKSESVGFEPGMLVFCLDAVVAPMSLTTFGKKDADANETFRVKDLCVVVGMENGRPMVVSITASAYELRFLEALMLEKARKAILDAREFYYVAVKPSKPLTDAAIKEIEQLGNVYAQGGSRRSLTVESSGPMEPAVALLAALGVRLNAPVGKQVLDVGSICHMLFAAEGRQQEDKNRTLIKSCFTRLAGNLPLTGQAGAGAPVEAQAEQADKGAAFPVDSSGAAAAPEVRSSSLDKEAKTQADPNVDITEGFDYSLFEQVVEPPAEPAAEALPPPTMKTLESASKENESNTGAAIVPETYKQLAETLSGLLAVDSLEKPSEKSLDLSHYPAAEAAQEDVGPLAKPAKARDAREKSGSAAESPLLQTSNPAQAIPLSQPPEVKSESEHIGGAKIEKESSSISDWSTGVTATGDHEPITVEISKLPPLARSSFAQTTSDNISAAHKQEVTESSMSTTSPPFQEPQAVMNEMASLMSKLEQQVSKASKKLASKAEEIEHRLNRSTESLMEEASQDDKNTEASILVLCDSLTKQFEQLSEELRLKISDAAAAGRESIKSLQAQGQTEIDEARANRQEGLLNACKDFRSETESLAQVSEEQFHKIVSEHMEQAEGLIKTVLGHLKEIADDFENRLNLRFKRFTERMAEESGAVINSIQRNVHSMEEEIDGSWERASEKLKSSQGDFEQTIEHTLTATELSIAQTARILLVEQFLPKLKERKEIVLGMSTEMAAAFYEQALSQTRSQLTGLDTSLASARQQLHTLAEECLARIDSVGRQQQAGLEDLFKDTSGFMERSTADVLTLVDKTEQQIQEVEGVCKKLAETSSLDTDPHLSEERNAAVAQVQSLKGRLKAELDRTLESNCTQLEQLGQSVQSQLNTRRIEQTQVIREASESGLNRIKEAIQEAFNSVQSAREKYME